MADIASASATARDLRRLREDAAMTVGLLPSPAAERAAVSMSAGVKSWEVHLVAAACSRSVKKVILAKWALPAARPAWDQLQASTSQSPHPATASRKLLVPVRMPEANAGSTVLLLALYLRVHVGARAAQRRTLATPQVGGVQVHASGKNTLHHVIARTLVIPRHTACLYA
jgi:hypothetical protein